MLQSQMSIQHIRKTVKKSERENLEASLWCTCPNFKLMQLHELVKLFLPFTTIRAEPDPTTGPMCWETPAVPQHSSISHQGKAALHPSPVSCSQKQQWHWLSLRVAKPASVLKRDRAEERGKQAALLYSTGYWLGSGCQAHVSFFCCKSADIHDNSIFLK